MAYDNNGGAKNAMKYFNDLYQARYGAMMGQKDGIALQQGGAYDGITDNIPPAQTGGETPFYAGTSSEEKGKGCKKPVPPFIKCVRTA